jgi:hypothetical protein
MWEYGKRAAAKKGYNFLLQIFWNSEKYFPNKFAT